MMKFIVFISIKSIAVIAVLVPLDKVRMLLESHGKSWNITMKNPGLNSHGI